jgi:hypothetical protein
MAAFHFFKVTHISKGSPSQTFGDGDILKLITFSGSEYQDVRNRNQTKSKEDALEVL